ncbi:MAG: hypothetical protein HYT65_01870 [Candidatus Yanofskybacteria bacterium]|nr:hypothetical protein [Candidatus Yanofskybacteria bacterium]
MSGKNIYLDFDILAFTGLEFGHTPTFTKEWGSGCSTGHMVVGLYRSGCSCGWRGLIRSVDDGDAIDGWLKHAKESGIIFPAEYKI